MNRKAQRKLARILTALTIILGVGAIALLLTAYDNPLESTASRKKETVTDRLDNLATQDIDFRSLFNARLQIPLVPPEQNKSQTAQEPSQPAKPWPKVSLDCIIASNSSKVAVFTTGNRSFTCEQGDEFLNVVVEKIGPKEVELKFAGESRTFQILGFRK